MGTEEWIGVLVVMAAICLLPVAIYQRHKLNR